MKELNCRQLKDLPTQCDIVTPTAFSTSPQGPLRQEDAAHMKKGAWLVNTARGAICVKEDSIYQPAPADHPWISMRNEYGAGNAMTPHTSGTCIDCDTPRAPRTF
ncbi:Formate dehydrogenase [Yarrowia sp. B02]|nr:Formate dehydrogenase [Yarrowia sp. B02]